MSEQHWKLQRDLFYRALLSHIAPYDLEEAGFFWDTAPIDEPLDDVHWLSTPLTKARQNLKKSIKKPAVLLSTGAFCPPHQGHLNMMAQARACAINHGFDIIAGYLSPGHDEYIRLKCAEQAMEASARLWMCAQATASSDWLDVDAWEALWRPCAVNFTDVIVRLERYLQHHLKRHIPVIYVCGGDNARFALTFATQGHCIVVSRPGSTSEHIRTHPHIEHNPRIMWTPLEDHSSSTRVRQGQWSLVPSAARTLPSTQTLVLRCEDPDICPELGLLAPAQWAHFVQSLVQCFESTGLHVIQRDHRAQYQRLQHLIEQQEHRIVSLDPMLPTAQNFAISRYFSLLGYTQRGWGARPGHPSIEVQRQQLLHQQTPMTLFDDDSYTGKTFDFARQHLGSCVVQTQTASSHVAGAQIADARDFLLGTLAGGLVVDTPSGQLARAPYILPYVDPFARSGVPAAHSLSFSLAVWRLQYELFSNLPWTIAHLPTPSQHLFLDAGFAPTLSLAQLCLLHVNRLAHDLGQT